MSSVFETLQQMPAGEWLDVLFAALVLWGTARGLSRGFLREVLGFAGVVVGFGVAGAFHRAVHVLSGIDFGLSVPALAASAWYVVLWVAVWLVFKLIAEIAHHWTKTEEGKVALSTRLSGALFGVLRSGVLVAFVTFFLAALDTKRLPFGQSAEDVLGRSRAIQFARANPQWVDALNQVQGIRWINDQMLESAAREWLAQDLGLSDPDLRASSARLLKPILERPEKAQRLPYSPTALRALAEMEQVPAFQQFAEQSEPYRKLRAGEPLDLARVREMMKSPAARQLLADDRALMVLRSVDYEQIARELEPTETPR